MDIRLQELQNEYRELEQIHHQALHELADAAQIIKSYEYLDTRQQQETVLLKRIVQSADELCYACESLSFNEKRKELIRAIHEYRVFSSTGTQRVEHVAAKSKYGDPFCRI